MFLAYVARGSEMFHLFRACFAETVRANIWPMSFMSLVVDLIRQASRVQIVKKTFRKDWITKFPDETVPLQLD